MNLLSLEKSLILPYVRQGGTAVDFTMGNGHDTLWLSEQVGETGKVYAFDVQQAALDSTAKLLAEHGRRNCTLILDSHANVRTYVREPFDLGLFNFGWLPGGDKTVTTRVDSSLTAMESAIGLLAPRGGILAAVYPGHPEGAREAEALTAFLGGISTSVASCACFRLVNAPDSPFFFLIEKNKG